MKKNIMKKSLAVLVAVCMLLGMFPAASFAASFNDINSSHWAWEYVNDAVDRGLFQGTGSGTFEPETNMSRAMFVVALSNFDGLVDTSTVPPADSDDADDADDQTADDQTADDADTNDDDAEEPAPAPTTPSSTSFSDVAAGQWYSDAVAWASANSIVAGLTETTFGPNDNITREQMASLIVRYASYAGITLENSRAAESFSDSSSISSYASSAVTQCYRSGLINGMGDGTFAPQATATRAQVTVVISKLAALSRGESIIDDEDADTFTVRFDSNGGSAVESQTVKKGEKATRPTNPTKSGFSFGGWYTDEDLKTSYNFNTAVTSSFTLYAKWNTPGSGGGGGGGNGGTQNYVVTFNYDDGVNAINLVNSGLSLGGSNNNQVTVSSGTVVEFGIVREAGYKIKNVDKASKVDESNSYKTGSITSNTIVTITTEAMDAYGMFGTQPLYVEEGEDTNAGTTYIYVPYEDIAALTPPSNVVKLIVKGDVTSATIDTSTVATVATPVATDYIAADDQTTLTVTFTGAPVWGTTDVKITDGTGTLYTINFHASAAWNVSIKGQGTVTVKDNGHNDDLYRASGYGVTDPGNTTVTLTPAAGYRAEYSVKAANDAGFTNIEDESSLNSDPVVVLMTPTVSTTYTIEAEFIDIQAELDAMLDALIQDIMEILAEVEDSPVSLVKSGNNYRLTLDLTMIESVLDTIISDDPSAEDVQKLQDLLDAIEEAVGDIVDLFENSGYDFDSIILRLNGNNPNIKEDPEKYLLIAIQSVLDDIAAGEATTLSIEYRTSDVQGSAEISAKANVYIELKGLLGVEDDNGTTVISVDLTGDTLSYIPAIIIAGSTSFPSAAASITDADTLMAYVNELDTADLLALLSSLGITVPAYDVEDYYVGTASGISTYAFPVDDFNFKLKVNYGDIFDIIDAQ